MAISTIIGSFFFIVIMVGAFGAFILMMQTNSEFLNTQLGTSQNEIEKIQGQFTIAAAYDSEIGNRLCVSVKNAGSTPLEITDLFIVNKTNNAVRLFDIDFRDAFVPVSSLHNILDNQPITLTAEVPGGTIYDIKVVSTSGIVKTTELKVFSDSSPDPRFDVTAFAYPANAASGQNVTIGMHVYNRANTTLINVQPEEGYPTVDPAEAVSEGFPLTTPAIVTRLDPNEDALFSWEPEFVGGIGSRLDFTVRAKAQVEGCTTSSFIFNEDSALVKVVPGVKKQILASPESFISFPNPFGDVSGTTTGIFSLVILNPTDQPFKVNQVSIQLVNPNDDDLVFSVTGAEPTTGWTNPGKNVIIWTNIASPVTVKANDIEEFIVRARPTGSAGTTPVTSIIYNIYSTFGQFGKGPFTHGVSDVITALVNTYAKTSFSGTTETFAIKDVPSGTEGQRFNFAISNTGSQVVSSGAYMLINIPPGLRDITDVSTTPNTDGLSLGLAVHDLIEFDDGSSQKPIELTSDLAAGTSRTYSLTATMPSVSVPAFYTFTVVANGTTGNSVIIGPFAEIVVQVCPLPTGVCP